MSKSKKQQDLDSKAADLLAGTQLLIEKVGGLLDKLEPAHTLLRHIPHANSNVNIKFCQCALARDYRAVRELLGDRPAAVVEVKA